MLWEIGKGPWDFPVTVPEVLQLALLRLWPYRLLFLSGSWWFLCQCLLLSLLLFSCLHSGALHKGRASLTEPVTSLSLREPAQLWQWPLACWSIHALPWSCDPVAHDLFQPPLLPAHCHKVWFSSQLLQVGLCFSIQSCKTEALVRFCLAFNSVFMCCLPDHPSVRGLWLTNHPRPRRSWLIFCVEASHWV